MAHLIIDHDLPVATDINAWLREPYRNYYSRQLIDEMTCMPFAHFVLPKLLNPEVFRLLSVASEKEFSRQKPLKDDDERGMEYCLFMLRPALDFFCGPIFRKLLGSIIGRRIERARNGSSTAQGDGSLTWATATFGCKRTLCNGYIPQSARNLASSRRGRTCLVQRL